jgi:hypothetical protein
MKHRKPEGKTLAAELDRTRWDYSAAKDRSFLLTSVLNTFASVAWEIAPQHLTPVRGSQENGSGSGEADGVDTRPIERLDLNR